MSQHDEVTIGCDRRTTNHACVYQYVQAHAWLPISRRNINGHKRGSIVDEVGPWIRELLAAYPRMPATVIAERIGWTPFDSGAFGAGGAELRPVYLPPDPASRTAYATGEIAQCDLWFPPVELPVGFDQTRKPTQLPVLTMICAYSRWLSALLIPSRCAADLFAGWWRLIAGLGAVPRALVWDGEGAIGRWRAGRAELQRVSGVPRGVGGQGRHLPAA